MRFRTAIWYASSLISILVFPLVTQAKIPFLGPIIPLEQNVCPANWALLIVVINNLISFALTFVIVFVAPVMIAYAGFIYVTNPMNPSGIGNAKSILTNTVIGVIVALSAWLIVDALMAVLYHPDNPGPAWSALIYGNSTDLCLRQKGSLPTDTLSQAHLTGISATGNVIAVDGASAAQCSPTNPACSVSALMAAGFTSTQANVMSCIAVTENSGNAAGCNGNACGTFQIMLTVNPLVGPACAKYNNGNPTLNCPALCKARNGGAVKNEPSCQPCFQASQDAACNAQAARYLYSKSGYAPWTTSSDNTKSSACVQKYGNT